MKLSNPILIEVTGSLGLGKSWLVESLSKTFGCPGINFPTLDPNSFTSTALLQGYQQPSALINNAHWWAHMSAANIWEQWSLLHTSPLIILKNYVTGYKCWFGACGVHQASEYLSGLPRPNLVFVCRGENLNLSYAMQEPTNEWLESGYERRLAQLRGPHIHTIEYNVFKERTLSAESLLSVVSLTMAEKIRNKYNFAFQLRPKRHALNKLQELEDHGS